MVNSIAMFTFSVLDWKCSFCDDLVQRNQNYLSKLKFDTYFDSNMPHSMAIFTFSASHWKYIFLINMAQKFFFFFFKLTFGNWTNLNMLNCMLNCISWIWIRWWCSLFLFWTRNTLARKIWSRRSEFSI